MSMDGQGIKWHRKTVETFIRLSMVHERYRQRDDGWATAYSEHSLIIRDFPLLVCSDISASHHFPDISTFTAYMTA